jgi:drug/metabolite transporter (DMT)-like permease
MAPLEPDIPTTMRRGEDSVTRKDYESNRYRDPMSRGAADRNYWIGAACAIGAAVLFGTSWVAVGVALEGFSPFVLAAWRSAITVVLMVPLLVWLARRGDSHSTIVPDASRRRGRLVRITALGFLGGVWFGIGMNISIMLTGASITAFIAGAYPVLAAAAAPFVLGERVRVAAYAGLALAFTGVLLIAGFDVAGVPVEGLAVAAATCVGTAMFMLLSRKWQRPWGIRSTHVTFANFVLLGPAGLALGLAGGDELIPAIITFDVWLAVLWLALTAGVIATILIMESFRRLPTSESSAFLMLNPLTAAVLAVPVLGEMLSPIQLVGAALVLAGIGLATGTFALVARFVRGRRSAVTTRRSQAPSP